MSRSAERIFFGIHNITPINRSTGMSYGTAKVVGEGSMESSGELIELYGGASPNAYAAEDSIIKSDLTIKLKEYPVWLWTVLWGKAPTVTGADTAGAVSTITNKYGTSVVAATGIATAGIKSGAKTDLKFGRYVVKAISPTTVKVYCMSDVDFGRGTDKSWDDDDLSITPTALTIVASTGVEVAGFGIELTGGAGTIAMTIGDTATFEVKPPSTAAMDVKVGGAADVRPEFSLIIVGQQRSNGEMIELEVFRAKGFGMPLLFSEKKFGEIDIKLKPLYDSAQDGLYRLRWIAPS